MDAQTRTAPGIPPTSSGAVYDFKGKIAIVTGASRGIGLGIAKALAAAGATLAVCARDEELLTKIFTQQDAVTPHLAKRCDVREEQSIKEFVRAVANEFGRIDILVNNAGVYHTQPVLDHPLQLWNDILSTNLTSAMLFCRETLPYMLQQNWGRIINISSVSGRSGEIWASAYSASKFGMVGLTQTLALEVAHKGITVNAICPGWVQTELAQTQLSDPNWCKLNSVDQKESVENALMAVPQMRFIQPEEIAGLVMYLSTPAAMSITGQSISICGGLSIH